MQITKEFRIFQVQATNSIEAPFKIILWGNSFKRDEYPSLTLDADTCARYDISMSLDLVGRTLVCSFESHELSLKAEGHFAKSVDMNLIESDDLMINSLNKNERMRPSLSMIPPSKHSEVSRTLELSSFGGGGIHFNPAPCPFYRIVLELTEEEYETCRMLPPTSVFRASFRLA